MAVPVLSDPKWLLDLAFLVDITQALNVLNKRLQGQGQLVSAAYDNVRAFSTKRAMESPAVSDKPLSFPCMQDTHGCGHTIQW